MANNQRLDVREYIGARYIPMFYDNGEGSAEWDQTAEYEPLTIVIYQGNSYTSRQYVPSGIQITDTRYWLQTGNWSSQIEAYRQEVLTFDDRITDNADNITALQNRAAQDENNLTQLAGRVTTAEHDIDELQADIAALEGGAVVAIGDSWGTGWTGAATVQSWISYLSSMGRVGTMLSSAVGGAGFVAHGQTDKNFNGLLAELGANTAESVRMKVKKVIALGGVNDGAANASYDQILNNLAAFCNTSRQYFPNAEILIGDPGAMMGSARWGQHTVLSALVECAGRCGAKYINGIEYVALGSEPGTDNFHLANYSRIGAAAVQALIGGDIETCLRGSITMSPAITGETLENTGNFNLFINNDIATLIFPNYMYIHFTGTADGKVNAPFNAWVDIANITCNLNVFGSNDYAFFFTQTGYALTQDGWKMATFPCRIQNGVLSFRVNTGSTSTVEVRQITLQNSWVVVPTYTI